MRGIVTSVSVCLSVRQHISETTRPNFYHFPHYGALKVGPSVWRYNTLRASVLVGDVMFSCNGPYDGVTLRQHGAAVYVWPNGLTPPHDIGCVAC